MYITVAFLTIHYFTLQTLAEIVSQEDLDSGSLYPPLKDIQNCSVKIAKKVVEYAYETSMYSFFSSLGSLNFAVNN